MERFTIDEIRKYIESQDSMGDILYNLSVEKIEEANTQGCDCDDDMIEPHSCPYQEDINGLEDNEFCTCCGECENECMQSI